jgi:hydroxyacylglutathione hydrolase
MEITPAIHRINRVLGSNCYLIIMERQMTLIDTGLPGQAGKIISYIKKLGRKSSDVKLIILTHADIDHIGCALDLKQLTGARIAIHEKDAPILTGKQRFKAYKRPQPLRYIASVITELMPFHPVEPDILLEDGNQINDWFIVHTPGHTLGSICLYRPGETIFVGDALATTLRGKPRNVSHRVSVDMAQMKKSMIAISSLDFEILCPGHGSPLLYGASQKVRDFLARQP